MNEFVDSTGSIKVLRRPIVVEASGYLHQNFPSPVITKYYDGTSDVGSLLGLQEAADQSHTMTINGSSTSITAGIIDGDDATFNSSPTIAARAFTTDYTATEVVNATYDSSANDDRSGPNGEVRETAAWVSVSGDALLSGASAGNYDIFYKDEYFDAYSDQTIDGTTYENAVRIRLKIAPRPVSLSATRAYDGTPEFDLSDISVATGVSGEALTLSQINYTEEMLRNANALVPVLVTVEGGQVVDLQTPLAPTEDGYAAQVSGAKPALESIFRTTLSDQQVQAEIAGAKTTYDALTTFAYRAIENEVVGEYTAVQDITSSSVILSVTGPHELVASGSETLNNYCLSNCFTVSGDLASGFRLGRPSTTTLTNNSLSDVTVLDITASADITAKPVSITPTSGLQKLVGDSDPTFTYTATGVLDGETLSGALSRASGETAGEYAYTVGTLASLNTNYSFSLTSETFEIYSSIPLTLSGFTLLNKLYDGSASGALSLVSSWGTLAGAFSGSDQSTVALDTSSATLTFGQVDVGSDLSVTVANLGLTGTNSSAYSVANFTTTADITARPISLTASTVSKTYGDADPTLAVTAATATGTTGLASTDTLAEVTGSLSRESGENVGSYDVALGSGSKAGNYSITFDTDNNALTIGQRAITLAATSVSKVYGESDPTLAVTITSGSLGSSTVSDVLADVSGTLTRESGSNVGSYDVVLGSGAEASNYDITFVSDNDAVSITRRPLTATGSVSGKTYDGGTEATVSLTLSNLVGSETISSSVEAAFGSPNVGSQTATVSSVILSDGTGGGLANNYSLAVSDITLSGSGQATISPKSLTATASVSDKVYDKTDAADVTLSFDGLVGAEDLGQTVAASFSSALAGTRQATIDSFSISNGTAGLAANYSLSGGDIDFSSNTATITRKTLSVSGAGTASDKIYDGTTSVIADISGLTFSGLLAGDSLGTPAASFSDANAGSNKAVSISFTGGDGANYVVPSVSGLTATITPKALAGVATVSDKAYDGNTSADVSMALSGFVLGETLETTVAASFDSKNVGTRTATIDSVSLSDTDTGLAANYSLANSDVTFSANTAAITPKSLTGVATVSGRAYEAGNTDANVSITLSGLVTGETLNTTVTGVFDSAEEGRRTATIANFNLLDGTGLAENYTLTLNNISFANNTALIGLSTPAGAAYRLGKENRLVKPIGARPLLISANDEDVTELPAVQRTLPPTDEELQNSRNTQFSQGEVTQEAQTQTTPETDEAQQVRTEELLTSDNQLNAQIQGSQPVTNLVFALRDARSVSLESLMLASNEPLIISASESSSISSIRHVDPIEIEEEEEVEVPLDAVFPSVSLSDDINVAISFTNGNKPQWARVNRVSQSVSIRPPSGVKGVQTLRLGVADEAGNMAATSLRVVVSSRNALAERSTNDQASIDQPTINLARTAIQDLPGFLSVQALRPSKFDAGSRFVFEVPNGTFVHENSGEPLRYVATLADGSPLPSWMTFDPETQTFSGEAPDGTATQLDVIVKAIDSASQEAQVQLRIEIE